jgi:hypothetical protein
MRGLPFIERIPVADQVVEEWFARTGKPGELERDGAYQIQWTTLRMLLARLETVLRGFGFGDDLMRPILAAMLDDAPDSSAAEERMREFARAIREAKERPAAFVIDREKDPELWAAAQKLHSERRPVWPVTK